ncbi:hypothetical protein AAF712_014376 [Marasmius tenuissimus]|uniref:DUF6535 domain-containing protein n=1 Tax=Marasmius tenuissimus TaxID=585030 RepID=A0ABR2ZCG6_9AGAR|nr:hypothetical protein PM082_009445 [Marasmius tenuissimus]
MSRPRSTAGVEKSVELDEDGSTSDNASNASSGGGIQQKDDPSTDFKVGDAWGRLAFQVLNYDEGILQTRTADMDSLLAFSGLFSILVGVFVIDSFKQLSENPADATVALLTQITQQLANPNSNNPISPPSRTSVPPSSVVLNCFWFLSLILSLTSSLLALLCKQWLQVHRQEAPTSTPSDTLALRQLRHDSFDKWGIPNFLATPCVLLQLAILFFFAGLIDLLWNLQSIPVFAIGVISIGIGATVYIVTTFLPGITVLFARVREAEHDFTPIRIPVSYESTCPYKSPQAWGVLRLLTFIVGMPPFLRLGYLLTHPRRSAWKHSGIFSLRIRLPHYTDATWSSLDYTLVRKWENMTGACRMYQLSALRWIVGTCTFRDTPPIREWVKTVLLGGSSGELATVLPAVFPEWLNVWMWVEPRVEDLEWLLHPGTKDEEVGFGRYDWVGTDCHRSPVQLSDNDHLILFNASTLYDSYIRFERSPTSLAFAVKLGLKRARELSTGKSGVGLGFTLPFWLLEKVWTHPDPEVREAGVTCLALYREEWERSFKLEWGMEGRYALVACLAEHLSSFVPVSGSALVEYEEGIDFVHFVHQTIVEDKVGQDRSMGIGNIVDKWRRAIERVQEHLVDPEGAFEPIASIVPNVRLSWNFGAGSFFQLAQFGFPPSFTPPAIPTPGRSIVVSFDELEGMGYIFRNRASYLSASGSRLGWNEGTGNGVGGTETIRDGPTQRVAVTSMPAGPYPYPHQAPSYATTTNSQDTETDRRSRSLQANTI